MFVSLSCKFSFTGSLVHFLFIKNNGETYRNNTFRVLRFQGHHFKSGIAIFALRVTWNYAYSPFNKIFTARSINSNIDSPHSFTNNASTFPTWPIIKYRQVFALELNLQTKPYTFLLSLLSLWRCNEQFLNCRLKKHLAKFW